MPARQPPVQPLVLLEVWVCRRETFDGILDCESIGPSQRKDTFILLGYSYSVRLAASEHSCSATISKRPRLSSLNS